MNDRSILVAIASFVLGGALVFFWPKSHVPSSERIRKLEEDSAAYVARFQSQAVKYARIDSAYRHDMDSLTLALDKVINARRNRPPSRIHSGDSLLRAIERAVGRIP